MVPRSSLVWVLVLLAASWAGCAGPGSGDAERLGTATIAPGTTAHLPIVLDNATLSADEATVEVVDSGDLDVTPPERLHGGPDEGLAGWVEVQAPDDASTGATDVTLRVSGPEGSTREGRLAVTVEDAGSGLGRGTIAVVDVVARTADGEIGLATNRTVAESPLPKTDSYRSPSRFQPVPVQLSRRGQLPTAVVDALAGSAVNHSLTVHVPEAFGPETREENLSREETINRTREQPLVLDLSRRQAQAQGLVDRRAQEGDRVNLPNTGLPYVIDRLNETNVRLQFTAQEGDNVTLYPAWPNATAVRNVTDEHAVLHTTPASEPGERFTWRDAWPNASEVVRVTNETIVLRHSPEPGTRYESPTRRGGTVNVTVQSLGNETIAISRENPNPLGGEDIDFHVTIVDERPPRQPAPGQSPRPR